MGPRGRDGKKSASLETATVRFHREVEGALLKTKNPECEGLPMSPKIRVGRGSYIQPINIKRRGRNRDGGQREGEEKKIGRKNTRKEEIEEERRMRRKTTLLQ
jgi:hypothetical protein